ncbi:furin-like protease 2 isoform X2 [Ornithodoros turicata]|uniref:furin-like protease 2 isoform X2 n=1 Tax=Ornithodoros turicata TaxID=34597 RepID=UPI00313A0635
MPWYKTVVCRLRTRLWGDCVLLLLFLSTTRTSGEKPTFTNQFAVHVEGGDCRADEIARKHGFTNRGQIGTLEGFYLLEHHGINKRSTEHSQDHHSRLENEAGVHWVEQQVVKRRVKRDMSLDDTSFQEQFHRSYRIFSDPLYEKQWYLNGGASGGHDMNVAPAWERGYTGKGVVVTILDDGIQTNHPDLLQNYDPLASTDINDQDDDPMPQDNNDNKHGTRCAGEVAATALNDYCGVGVAYNASIGGVRMLDGTVTDEVEARALSLNPHYIAIYSASWGPEDDGKTVDGPGKLARQAFYQGITKGRRGLGSIFVWASGNGGRFNDSCNCDGYTNSIYTLSISSATQHGSKPWYLEECSSTLATTYSSGAPGKDANVVTVDMDLSFKLKSNADSLCTQSHTGTSASAPLAAGICALALEANPKLSWRDMQHLVVMTSRPEPLLLESGWAVNGVKRKVSHKFGYGLMDADGMVALAEQWTPVSQQHICRTSPDNVERIIPNRYGERLEVSMNVTGCAGRRDMVRYLEHVQVVVSLQFLPRGNLRITLVSPRGTRSHVLLPRSFDLKDDTFDSWPFMSVHFWGEPAAGTWKLVISSEGQRRSPYPGKLKQWYLIFYGTESDPVKLRPRPHASYIIRDTARLSAVENRIGTSQCSEHGKYDAGNLKCVEQCPDGQYGNHDTFTCEPCNMECDRCYGPLSDNCISCKSGRHLTRSSCWKECPDGTYADDSLGLCVQCDLNCAMCEKSAFNCTACKESYLLSGSSCTTSCPKGTYATSERRCANCHQNCETCNGPDDKNCITCIEGYHAYQNQCLSRCPPKFYSDGDNLCKSCVPPCLECNSLKSCKSCVSTHKWESGSCSIAYTRCGTGYYSPQGNCNRCHETCQDCYGPNENQCLSCPPSKYLYNGRCTSECLLAYYSSEDRVCIQCDKNCLNCSSSGSPKCTSCLFDLFLYDGVCVEQCPQGFFKDASSSVKRCIPCHTSCETCANASASSCLSCASGRTLHKSRCYPSPCPDGTYLRHTTSVGDQCIACHPACSKCTGPGPMSCSACSTSAFLVGNTCVSCLSDEYLSVDRRTSNHVLKLISGYLG